MLQAQRVVPATPATKIRLAVLATALCDALGGPAEFHPRFTFDFISHMKPNDNFGLPAGVWTDDTSMALALARSIATFESWQSPEGKPIRGGFDTADQLDAYHRWWQDGTLSATGRCFDIGNTIQRAVSLYHEALKTDGPSPRSLALRRISAALTPDSSKTMEREKRRAAAAGALGTIGHDLKGSVFGGNGSLMRVLPVGLAYWKDEAAAAAHAWRSSETTHPNPVCGEACAVWTACIARVVQSARQGEPRMTKLDVLHHFASYAYKADALRSALALPSGAPLLVDAVEDPVAMEVHYTKHHPLLKLRAECIRKSESAGTGSGGATAGRDDALTARTLALLPTGEALPSSGYVGGALLTANMGNDADTVAAVYGGLAGVWYASEEVEGGERSENFEGESQEVEPLFWSPLVHEWRAALVRRDMVEEVAEELAVFAEGKRRSDIF